MDKRLVNHGQAKKTVVKYECVVVKLDNVYIVASPGEVMDFGEPVSMFKPEILAAKPSFGDEPVQKPRDSKYFNYPYFRVGGDDFSDPKALQDSIRKEIQDLEGKLTEGEQLSLSKIRQHFEQKPEYVILGNYKPLPSQRI